MSIGVPPYDLRLLTPRYSSGKILQAAHFGRPAAFAILVAVSNL